MSIQKELTLPEIHEATLEILDKFIEICETNNIDYFVVYGSLIGVVRHQGFIPWDDDFDVGMLRGEFDRFCEYCHSHEKEMYPFKLLDRTNTPNYPFNIPRLCDLRYRMETDLIPDVGMGTFIDVYPFDGMGNDPSISKKLRMKKFFILSGLDYKNKGLFTPSKKNFVFTIVRYGIYLWSKTKTLDYFFEKLDSLRKNLPGIDDSKYVSCVIWGDISPCDKKEWINKTIYSSFEGRNVKIPVGFDAALKEHYGDYMSLPPEKNRIPHHDYKIFRK